MRAPSRTRRIAKWTGLGVCVGILAMWAASTRFLVARALPRAGIAVFWGQAHVLYVTERYNPKTMGVSWASGSTSKPWAALGSSNWHVENLEQFKGGLELPRAFMGNVVCQIIMPFWFLLTLAAIPTAILWHRDRRTVKPGCCRVCGYDLRASKKKCPECGTAIATAKTP